MKAEGEDLVLPVVRGHAESSFGLSFRCYGYLPIPFCEVECGEKPGPPEPVDEVIHSGHGIAVELSDLV